MLLLRPKYGSPRKLEHGICLAYARLLIHMPGIYLADAWDIMIFKKHHFEKKICIQTDKSSNTCMPSMSICSVQNVSVVEWRSHYQKLYGVGQINGIYLVYTMHMYSINTCVCVSVCV